MTKTIGRRIMVEHRYKSNDAPGAFGGFEWSGDTTDLIHVPGWFSDHVESVMLLENSYNLFESTFQNNPKKPLILHFTTKDGSRLTANPGDIVLFRLETLIVCHPDICKFFLKELM